MAELTINADDMQAWANKIAGAPAILQQEQLTAMQRSTFEVQRGAQSVVRTDMHNLQRSITPSAVTAEEGRVGTNLPYGKVMDKGREPGKPMPPKGVLLPWMSRHGIPPEAEYPIRRAIGEKGITGDGFLTKTFEGLKPQIRQEFAAILPRLIARMKGG